VQWVREQILENGSCSGIQELSLVLIGPDEYFITEEENSREWLLFGMHLPIRHDGFEELG
jgi:hypothetical protein